ncbi:MAG: hypothetical protein WC551_12255 [Patescibacteria group bacterium]
MEAMKGMTDGDIFDPITGKWTTRAAMNQKLAVPDAVQGRKDAYNQGLQTLDRMGYRNVDTSTNAVTPWAPLGPNSTAAQDTATAVRSAVNQGGVTNVRPGGLITMGPLFTNANFSASGVKDSNQINRAATEMAQAGQAVGANKALQSAAGFGMTREAQASRARQLEQDKINQGLASASQQNFQNKLAAEVMGKAAGAGTGPFARSQQDIMEEATVKYGQKQDQEQRRDTSDLMKKQRFYEQDYQKNMNPTSGRMAIDYRAQVAEADGDYELAKTIREEPYRNYLAYYQQKRESGLRRLIPGTYKGGDDEKMSILDHQWALTGLPPEQAPHRSSKEHNVETMPKLVQPFIDRISQSEGPVPVGVKSSVTPATGLQGQAPLRGATTVGQAPVTGVNTNQFVGVPGNVPQFTTVQEAEAAGLPKGTVIMIAGRKARVE